MIQLGIISAVLIMLLTTGAGADYSSLYAPATKDDLSALQSAVSSMQNTQAVKQSAIPSDGPGAGLCRQTIVPSELVTSGGVAGTPGTCSRILQCGTSAAYVVTQFNVGSGC